MTPRYLLLGTASLGEPGAPPWGQAAGLHRRWPAPLAGGPAGRQGAQASRVGRRPRAAPSRASEVRRRVWPRAAPRGPGSGCPVRPLTEPLRTFFAGPGSLRPGSAAVHPRGLSGVAAPSWSSRRLPGGADTLLFTPRPRSTLPPRRLSPSPPEDRACGSERAAWRAGARGYLAGPPPGRFHGERWLANVSFLSLRHLDGSVIS